MARSYYTSYTAPSHKPASNGCGTCGGGSYRPPTVTPPVNDPCPGGIATTGKPRESCGCAKCAAKTAPVKKNYNSDDCPTLSISCETKTAIRECVKVALCDFMRCTTDVLCPDGRFAMSNLSENKELGTQLIDCLGTALCSFMHCIPEALCPEEPKPTAEVDCLPCGYAVEVPR